jgi:serine/threonine-protein kinase
MVLPERDAAPARAEAFIPGFQLERLVGRGGMGAVYRARKLNIGKTVALKVLYPSLGEDPVYSERFAREVRSLAQLSHRNLVNVLDAGEAGELRYMVMDFVEGQNLAEVVAASGPLAPAEVQNAAEQALDALAFVHAQGMVHRDIKPANFILCPDGTVMLCDLGLVRVTGERSDLTQKLLLGTPEYISPEQARGDRELDIRSDLYSLGATLYFVATGRPPHTGHTPMQVAQKHLHEKVTPVRKLVPAFPGPLARFIERLLARRPEQRFAEPALALLALRTPGRKVPRSSLWTGAAAVVLLAAVATFSWRPGTPPAPAPGTAGPAASAPVLADVFAEVGEIRGLLERLRDRSTSAAPGPPSRSDLEDLERRLALVDQTLAVLERRLETASPTRPAPRKPP